MRTKSLLLLLVALGCGVVASVAVSQAIMEQGPREEAKAVDILVAAKDLSASSKIPADAVRIEQWPAEKVPFGAITDIKQLDGKFTKQRLYAGVPIMEAQLSAKGKEIVVPEGFRVFDIPVQSGTGADGYIGPGDRVDVIGFFDKGSGNRGSKTVTVLENVEVFLVDGVAFRDPEATTQKRASTIQLLVKISQLEVLNTASNVAKQLKLVLRPPTSDQDKGVARADNGEKFLDWLGKEAESTDKPKVDPVLPSTAQVAARPSHHEVLIVAPNKATLYRWNDGAITPQRVDMEGEAQAALMNSQYAQYQQPAPYTPPVQRNPISATKRRASSKDTSKDSDSKAKGNDTSSLTPPADPDGLVQPNLTWDPNNGAWQSGGFNATYP